MDTRSFKQTILNTYVGDCSTDNLLLRTNCSNFTEAVKLILVHSIYLTFTLILARQGFGSTDTNINKKSPFVQLLRHVHKLTKAFIKITFSDLKDNLQIHYQVKILQLNSLYECNNLYLKKSTPTKEQMTKFMIHSLFVI
jgi:hypothetical protein